MELEDLIDRHKQFTRDEPRADHHSVFYAQKVQEEGGEMISHSDNGEDPEQKRLATKESADALLALVGFWIKEGISVHSVIMEATLKLDELRVRYDSGYYDKPVDVFVAEYDT